MPTMDAIDLPEVDAFIAAVRAAGVTRVIIAWQREWTQRPGLAQVDYGQVQRSVVLAYDQGRILRTTVDGDEAAHSALRHRLEAAGFVVALRSRNTVGFVADR